MTVRVLIVDDSPTLRRIVRRCLEQAELGIEEIYEAGDGEEALELLSKHEVDFVLTDINMPKMDGIQLLSEMKQNERWKTIPVLMITTEATAEAVVGAAKLGASGYIRKPFTPTQIHDQLAPLIGSGTRT